MRAGSQSGLIITIAAAASIWSFAQAPQPGPPRAARDTQRDPSATPAGSISGRVLSADTGRAVTRARVFITAAELPQGRGVLTDDSGAFQFIELPAGRYTVTVSKTGFINLSYGQRRPMQPGTPLQLADGQQIKGIEFRLPRGGAITGRVLDENGDPMPGVLVQVMRYQNAQGTRQLVPAGAGQTDDRGQYRVWGLNPGDYYVSASADGFGGRGGRGGPLFGGPSFAGRGARGGFGPDTQDPPVGYAPTFYPGVPSVTEARPVTIALGGEANEVNFAVLLVRTARVIGTVRNSDGGTTWAGTVNLMPDGQPGRGGFGQGFAGRINYDGNFTIVNVPPGRYTLRARSTMRDEPPEFASMPVTVNGTELTVSIALAPGATITGTVSLDITQAAAPDMNQFRIALPAVEGQELGPQGNTRPDKDGKFSVEAVPQGLHWVRGQAPRGWTLKSVVYEGRDIIDTPLDVRSGQKIVGITAVFSDRLSEIDGTLTNEQGAPVTEYTVLAFPTDSTLWRAQSRHIMTTRPDQNGKFQIRGLPPGEYFLAAIDPAEPGEWFEPAFLDQHRAGAARLTIGEGQTKTQDFKAITR